MNDKSQPSPNIPLSAARKINEICKSFELAWRGSTRPQLKAFLADLHEPERSWLLVELLALEVELRRGIGEQPTEAEYRQSFPTDAERDLIAAAFQHCEDSQVESSSSAIVPNGAPAFKPTVSNTLTASRGLPVIPKIEGYDIIEVLGRGGMGVVYKARDRRLKRLVALKMILAGDHAGPEHLARFRREAEMVARLQHPNIVQIFDVGEQDGRPYLAFEFIQGPTLANWAGREPQPGRVAAELLETIAGAMQYAHQHGIVHRDLKPANILLAESGASASSGSSSGTNILPESSSGLGSGKSGRHGTAAGLVPKIMDFGLAKDLAGDLRHTAPGAILGTPNYMSPEQADCRGGIGPASDIYSLGAILYALLTGRPPFQSPTSIETLRMVVGSEPVAPTQLQPRLAKDLETICLKCLHKDPARRYETAGALAEDLRRFRNEEPILARPSGRIEKAWRWCRRNPSVAALVMSVALVLLAGVIVSSYFAFAAREEARLSRQAEANAKNREKAETAARKDADAQRERAETAIAESLLDQGLAHCENRNVTLGLLTMVRALEKAPPRAIEVRKTIRLNLAFWQDQVSVLKTGGGYQSSMTAVCFAPDGKSFLAGDWGNHRNIPGPPYLVVHNLLTGQAGKKITAHAQAIWCVAFSPDSKRFASASFDGTARLWDAATQKLIGKPMRHNGRVYSLAFSPNGKYLLTGSNKWGDQKEPIGVLQVWNADNGAAVGEPALQPGIVLTVAWSGDGKLWASGSAEIDPRTKLARGGEVRFWDALTRKVHGAPLWQSDPVLAVAFRPSFNILACATQDGLVRFWDPATGRRTGKMLQHRDAVKALDFSRDGRLLLTGSGENRPGRAKRGEARLWIVDTGQLAVQPMIHPAKVNDVSLSPDQHTIVAACDDGQIYIWRVGGSIRPDYILKQPGLQHTIATPDGGTVVTLSKNDANREIVIQHWDSRTGQPIGKPLLLPCTVLIAGDPNRIQGIRDVVLRPDGRWAASAEWLEASPGKARQGKWFFWDAVAHKLIDVPDEVRRADRLVFSHAGKRLAVCRRLPNGDSACRVWDVEHWRPFGKQILIKSLVYSLLFTADDDALLTGSNDGFVRRWRISDGGLLNVSEKLGNKLAALTLALSADGARLLTCRHNTSGAAHSQILDSTGMTPVGPNSYGRADWLFTCRFVPGGRHYVGHGNGHVQIWDSVTGRQLRTLNKYGAVAGRYAAHPSGEYVALGITPHQVRLWHLTTGKLVGPPMFFPADIKQLAFSSDGAALFVSCNDGAVHRLPMPAALTGTPSQVKSAIQTLTQKHLGDDGALLPLPRQKK